MSRISMGIAILMTAGYLVAGQPAAQSAAPRPGQVLFLLAAGGSGGGSGSGHDGAGHDGAGHDGAGHDGAGHDGAGNDGPGHDGASTGGGAAEPGDDHGVDAVS